MLDALTASSLVEDATGAVLRLALPWIRALPLAAVRDVEVHIDGVPVPHLRVVLGQRDIASADLAHEDGWWFVQDRLALRLGRRLSAGTHSVRVSFRLAVPYLQTGPDGPLILPFHFARDLDTVTPGASADAARDVA